MIIELWTNFIRRTHRSQIPYRKDTDARLKDALIAAWKREENERYSQICQELAEQVQSILNKSLQNETHIVCIMEKSVWARDEDDEERQYVMTKGGGWYLEWVMNDEFLLVIKSTSQ